MHLPILTKNNIPGDRHTGISDWSNCTRCHLHLTRKHVAIKRQGGQVGHTKLIFIGEAPGETEDDTGYPFIGTSGRILANLFNLVPHGFEYLITNIVGCRPCDLIVMDREVYDEDDAEVEEGPSVPKRFTREMLDGMSYGEDYIIEKYNRDPTPAESQICKPHIDELISTFQPAGVVYLGQAAKAYKSRLPKLSLFHPAYISRLECKLLTVRKEARKLNSFLEQLHEAQLERTLRRGTNSVSHK